MLVFPKSTEFNKRISKQKFYENIDVSPALKRVFVEQIKFIYWRNKLAESTINIAHGQAVTEIEVIEINLNHPHLDEAVLRQIDKEIPYHILFVLSYENKVQAWTGYKEAAASGNKAFKVNKYYHTDWISPEKLILEIKGLNLDTVWDNFIIQVGDLKLGRSKTLAEQIEQDNFKAKLTKDIEKLEKKARKEKQPNKKFELAQQVNTLKKKLGMRNTNDNSSLFSPHSSLDIGFRVLKLDSSNMKDVYYKPDEVEQTLFDNYANNIKEDRTPNDLLFQVMLDLGILLSSKIEETVIDGKKVFNVADGFLIACFDENVTDETITAIAKQKPYYFVMCDSSMASDSVATNFEQIFATYSPDTVRKVL